MIAFSTWRLLLPRFVERRVLLYSWWRAGCRFAWRLLRAFLGEPFTTRAVEEEWMRLYSDGARRLVLIVEPEFEARALFILRHSTLPMWEDRQRTMPRGDPAPLIVQPRVGLSGWRIDALCP